jgi:hypothetical protein
MQEKGAFAYTLPEVTGYTKGQIQVDLVDPGKRLFQSPRSFSDEELQFGDEKMAEMLSAGIVVEISTTNPYACNVTLPMKRAPDGSWTDKRFCIDLRPINSNSVVDNYGLPLPEDLFRKMNGAKYITKIDLRSGFWQLPLHESSKPYFAFWWRGKLYTFTRLPFGFVNATALFQRVMEHELQECGVQAVTSVFVDDVVLYTDTWEQHVHALRTMLQHFQHVGLKAHPAKTIVAADCIPYLGHLISGTQLRPEPAKIEAIASLQPPTSVNRLQAHLGLFNYYRCYVKDFSRLAQPLYTLLRKGAAFVWGESQDAAYNALKQQLCRTGNALRLPVAGRAFHLYVDWSKQGIAAVLNQRDVDGNEYMVACASRSLNAAEQNYPAWKGEMLAAVWGIKHFRPYLHAREFSCTQITVPCCGC